MEVAAIRADLAVSLQLCVLDDAASGDVRACYLDEEGAAIEKAHRKPAIDVARRKGYRGRIHCFHLQRSTFAAFYLGERAHAHVR